MSAAGAGLLLWLGFGISWLAAAGWAGRATERAGIGRAAAYLAGYAVGFGLLFPDPRGGPALRLAGAAWGRGWPVTALAVEAAGFAFAWWARLHLGRLWSGMMTLRAGHRVVESGPYGIVRHPIYTGLIAAAWATAPLIGGVRSCLGAAIVTGVMAYKARDEEALLRRTLGARAYDAYAACVPMLVPFSRRRRGARP